MLKFGAHFYLIITIRETPCKYVTETLSLRKTENFFCLWCLWLWGREIRDRPAALDRSKLRTDTPRGCPVVQESVPCVCDRSQRVRWRRTPRAARKKRWVTEAEDEAAGFSSFGCRINFELFETFPVIWVRIRLLGSDLMSVGWMLRRNRSAKRIELGDFPTGTNGWSPSRLCNAEEKSWKVGWFPEFHQY